MVLGAGLGKGKGGTNEAKDSRFDSIIFDAEGPFIPTDLFFAKII